MSTGDAQTTESPGSPAPPSDADFPATTTAVHVIKVAVVGATGTLGHRIAKRAADAGLAVTAVVRAEDKTNRILDQTIPVKVANLVTGEGLSEAFEGQDIVIEAVHNEFRPAGVGA